MLLTHLTYLARKNGLLSFNAIVLGENTSMLKVLKKQGFTTKLVESGVVELEKVF
jgi:RimJ/RimL family protein N-acetyltransferase